jgi:hypothetical protein
MKAAAIKPPGAGFPPRLRASAVIVNTRPRQAIAPPAIAASV